MTTTGVDRMFLAVCFRLMDFSLVLLRFARRISPKE